MDDTNKRLRNRSHDLHKPFAKERTLDRSKTRAVLNINGQSRVNSPAHERSVVHAIDSCSVWRVAIRSQSCKVSVQSKGGERERERESDKEDKQQKHSCRCSLLSFFVWRCGYHGHAVIYRPHFVVAFDANDFI